MAFDTAAATLMVREISTLIDKTDAEIAKALTTQAVPKIRLWIMTARDRNGAEVFYSSLAELGDPTVQANAETILSAVLEEPTVKAALLRCAAMLAASSLILSELSVVDSQVVFAKKLDKDAETDLLLLAKSPLMRQAVQTVAKVVADDLPGGVGATLFLATDIDPDTLDFDAKGGSGYAGAQLPYAGAPEAGKISAIINGIAIEATVNEGDMPYHVFQRLVLTFEGMASSKPNLSLAQSEVALNAGTRFVISDDPVTGETTRSVFTYSGFMAKLAVLPHNYDNTLDVAVVTLSLVHRDQANPSQFLPGIKGFIYGTADTVVNLTTFGPHAIAVDLKTGKTTGLSSPGADSESTNPISDSLFFQLPNGPLGVDGQVTYRINDSTSQTVPVLAGADALGVVEAIAQDLANKALTQRMLGAVRPSSLVTINGTPTEAPGLELVAYAVEKALSRIILTVLTVPDGVLFGVVPNTLITQANFDSRAKSVVVRTTVNLRTESVPDGPPSAVVPTGDVLVAQHIPSAALSAVLAAYGRAGGQT